MNQSSIYTISVKDIPENYANASSSYKRHMWIAVAGIVTFFLLYILLSVWFFYTGYRLLNDSFGGGNSGFFSTVGGFAAIFLGVFMIKAFFFVKTNHDVEDHEVTATTEPRLFDYLHKLADEIGAPRPHRVYISNRVNACVFYDLSILNLFWPSKKNLEIGLGLINVLNLGELKAVLAHEFGHFAQRSMLIGRWVYIANQIAAAIIGRRDALDKFLAGLSRIDFRIAWIGWILSLIVWSIRSLVEIVFKLVVLSQRALSREMEFQADLVAVSVTGSDALIHALHKLQAADSAFNNSLNTINKLLNEKKLVPDLYEIQSNAITQTSKILNDPEYGKSPKIPSVNPDKHRVFSERIAQPPKMWATHPPDQEREANAKELYINAQIDDRSAWDLFMNAVALRIELTKDLYKGAKVKVEDNTIQMSEALSFQNQQWERDYYDSKYKGIYVNRLLFQDYHDVDSIYNSLDNDWSHSELYPDSLVEDLEDYTTLRDELVQLEALEDKRLTTSGSKGIWHRGVQVSRQQLPDIIASIKEEVNIAKNRISQHDLKVRNEHIRMANEIGQGWSPYLKSLARLIHYSEHTMEDLKDAFRVFTKVLHIVMADNKVTKSEMQRVVATGNDVHQILFSIHKNKPLLHFDERMSERLGSSWAEKVDDLGLPRALPDNLNKWVPACSGWVGLYLEHLDELRSAALCELIKAEDDVQGQFAQNSRAMSPTPSSIGFDYKSFVPGQEREVVDKLTMWDKFVMSDGIIPSLAKFGVALSIVGATIFAGRQAGNSDLTIYNGLGTAVHVDVGHSSINVPAHSSYPTHIKISKNFTIKTETPDGQLIEKFSPETSGTSKHYVYNIAKAATLFESKIIYTTNSSENDENQEGKSLGIPRWIHTKADYILEEPPESIKTSSSYTSRDVLMAYSNYNPGFLLNLLSDENEISDFVSVHTKWDPPGSPHIIEWLSIAQHLEMGDLIDQRVVQYPEETASIRLAMDRSEVKKNEICDRYQQKAIESPENSTYYYIATRCMPSGTARDQAFLKGVQKWQEDGWLNYAAGYLYTRAWKWQEALDAYELVHQSEIGLHEQAALNVIRLERLLEDQSEGSNIGITLQSPFLNYYSSQIDGKDEGGFDNIFTQLNIGALDIASELAQKVEGDVGNQLVMIGASDGATDKMIETGLAQKAENLTDEAFLSFIGLRLRKNMSISDYEERINQLFITEELSVSAFIKAVKISNFPKAEKIMKKGGLTTQASLATLAYVMKKKSIPQSWRTLAKKILYPSERPFIL